MEKRFHSLLGELEREYDYHDLQVGNRPLEKAVAGLTKLIEPQYDSNGTPAFKSLREAYTYFTGDDEVRGFFRPNNVSKDLRSCQDFDSGTFSYALQNALNMKLSKDYKDFSYHEEVLISETKPAHDFREIHSIQLGYFGALPDVDPEAADYETRESYNDSEIKYRIGQKGAIDYVTRMHMINDSIGLIQAMIRRRAKSARLAHAKYIWSFYITNAPCPDSTAWFTQAHNNLDSNALDLSSLVTAITALANMTEPGSGEKIGFDLASFNWNLVVPIALWDTAVKVNQADSYFTSNDLTTKV